MKRYRSEMEFMLPICVHTDLTDTWTRSSSPSPVAITERWNNVRGEHLLVRVILQVCAWIVPIAQCPISIFYHVLPIFFLWVRFGQHVWVGTSSACIREVYTCPLWCNFVKKNLKSVLRKAFVTSVVLHCLERIKLCFFFSVTILQKTVIALHIY